MCTSWQDRHKPITTKGVQMAANGVIKALSVPQLTQIRLDETTRYVVSLCLRKTT